MENVDQVVKNAGVLVEALPYIKTFAGKIFVIKCGGDILENHELTETILKDIVLLKYIGVYPVLVHGGSNKIDQVLNDFGTAPEFVKGFRVTDAVTMEICEMALNKINSDFVRLLNKMGGKSVGLTGSDGDMLIADKVAPVPDEKGEQVDLGHVGEIKNINPELVINLSNEGYIPVIAPVAVDFDNNPLNVNGDHVAGELAGALGAEKLVILAGEPGVVLDGKLISTLSAAKAQKLIEEGDLANDMVTKLESCITALWHKVNRTHIIDSNLGHSLLIEIFTDKGIGTMVTER